MVVTAMSARMAKEARQTASLDDGFRQWPRVVQAAYDRYPASLDHVGTPARVPHKAVDHHLSSSSAEVGGEGGEEASATGRAGVSRLSSNVANAHVPRYARHQYVSCAAAHSRGHVLLGECYGLLQVSLLLQDCTGQAWASTSPSPARLLNQQSDPPATGCRSHDPTSRARLPPRTRRSQPAGAPRLGSRAIERIAKQSAERNTIA